LGTFANLRKVERGGYLIGVCDELLVEKNNKVICVNCNKDK